MPARRLGEAKRSRARLRGSRRTIYQTEWVLAEIGRLKPGGLRASDRG